MKKDFYRINKLPAYVFSRLNQLKNEAILEGKDVIDFGMGNPDSSPPSIATEKLSKEINVTHNHGYSLSRGIPELREAQAKYYSRRFGVELDPDTEIVATIGSKEGITSLAFAMTGPDDYILVSSPSYPIHSWGFIIADTNVKYLENSGGDFLNRFCEFLDHAEKKPLAIIVNYPCNPTGEVVDLDFYTKLVDICRKEEIYIISDLAYAEIYFEGNAPSSIFQVPGAKDVAVEFTSMSKSFSMAGWRVGFVVGNIDIISAIAKMKSYLDYGMFAPLQISAAHVLNNSVDYPKTIRECYKERRNVLVEGLRDAGWNVPEPKAAMYIWTKLPEKYSHLTSLEFSTLLFERTNIVVSPGNGFGDAGEGYVRIALVQDIETTLCAIQKIKKFLS